MSFQSLYPFPTAVVAMILYSYVVNGLTSADPSTYCLGWSARRLATVLILDSPYFPKQNTQWFIHTDRVPLHIRNPRMHFHCQFRPWLIGQCEHFHASLNYVQGIYFRCQARNRFFTQHIFFHFNSLHTLHNFNLEFPTRSLLSIV